MSDLSDLVCLAHDHGDREQEAICSARFQIAALRSQLAAEREARLRAQRWRDRWHEFASKAVTEANAAERERDGWKHRAERAERQLSEVRLLCDDWPNYIALNVLNILDAAEGTP